MHGALFVCEYAALAAGIRILDELLKKAPVKVLYGRPVCIGKFVILTEGDASAVREAEACADGLPYKPISKCVITSVHPILLDHLRKPRVYNYAGGALGIFETRTVSTGIEALDQALKSADVRLLKLDMGFNIGGKSMFIIGGDVSAVTAALNYASGALSERDLIGKEIIAAPDPGLLDYFFKSFLNLKS
ncbi:MAG: BMC domain-containing protein [Clostridiales bacterium]|jgi:microcompartment protein CcmL/EutN|nr:BMC domain-containing protein [Clostridiales bacterium]